MVMGVQYLPIRLEGQELLGPSGVKHCGCVGIAGNAAVSHELHRAGAIHMFHLWIQLA